MPRPNRGPHLWRPRGSTGPWFVRRFEQGRAVTRSTGETDRRLAEAALARWVLAAQQPKLPPEPTVADILEAYAAARRGRHTGQNIARICRHIAAVAGPWRPAEITQRHIARYIQLRQRAPNTVRTELGYLRAALRWAAAEDLIAPPRPWRIELHGTRRDRWLTEAECAKLMAAADKLHVRTFLALALHTGARSGAILELRWADVDLERGVVAYPARIGGKRRASVPINETLRQALTEARQAATSPFVVEWAGAPVGRLQSAWTSLLRRAGIAHCTRHDLRRTAGSLMLQRGVPIELVSAVLGHSNIGITRSTYAHLEVDHLRDAVRRLG